MPHIFYNIVCLLEKKHPLELCKNMTNGGSVNQQDIDDVQKSVANLEILNSILPILLTTIFCLFLGAWSDTHGRKPFLVMPFVASCAMLLIYMINYALFYELNVYHLLWVGALGLSSGKEVIKVAIFGYVGNPSTHD